MTQLYLSYDAVSKYNTRTQELALMVLNFIITIISIFFGFEYYLGHTLSSCSGINSVYTDTRNIGLFLQQNQQDAQYLKFIYFGTTLYMFQTVSPSIVRSLRLYKQHQVYVIQVLWPLASKQPQNLFGMMLHVQYQTPDDGRRDRPKHVERCSTINKFEILCIWLILLQKYITMHGPTNAKLIYVFLKMFYDPTFQKIKTKT